MQEGTAERRFAAVMVAAGPVSAVTVSRAGDPRGVVLAASIFAREGRLTSILRVTNGPSVEDRLAYWSGLSFAKEAAAPEVAYSLAGTLYLGSNGWLLLSVPNALVRGIFAALSEPGVELPPAAEGQTSFNAHITVLSKDEVTQIGPEKISERGKQFAYTLGRLKTVEPDGWPDASKVWYVSVHSPELQALRRSYGLSSRPHDGEYDFHITVGMRRRGVLGRNETSKAG